MILWPHMASWTLVNTGSDNGLLHGGTKPLPQPQTSNFKNSLFDIIEDNTVV